MNKFHCTLSLCALTPWSQGLRFLPRIAFFFCLATIRPTVFAQGSTYAVAADPAAPLANSSFVINVQAVDSGAPLTVTTDAPNVHDGFIDLSVHITRGTSSTGYAPYTVQFNVAPLAPGQYVIRYYYDYVPPHGPFLASSTPLTVGSGPQVGLWWNPNESGTGYSIDVKHGVLVATIYSYTPEGPPIWYLAFGPIDSNNTVTGTLLKYADGQCISCSYTTPVENGKDGAVTIKFRSPTTATMTLPGRAPFTIIPQEF